MTSSDFRRGAALLVVALAACGAEGAGRADSDANDSQQETSAQEVRACDVLDLGDASRVIGAGTEHPGGDTEQRTCMYVNPGIATLAIQLGPADYYDQVTILPPHTPVQVGDRGRSNVQETGAIAVQFVSGEHSATLALQPLGDPRADYLDLLVSAARAVAQRLP